MDRVLGQPQSAIEAQGHSMYSFDRTIERLYRVCDIWKRIGKRVRFSTSSVDPGEKPALPVDDAWVIHSASVPVGVRGTCCSTACWASFLGFPGHVEYVEIRL